MEERDAAAAKIAGQPQNFDVRQQSRRRRMK